MIEFIVAVGTFTGALLIMAALVTLLGPACTALGWELRYKVEKWCGRRQ